MPEPGLFRKSSLEKLSTPEQLDFLMQVTSPRGWMALWTLCALVGAALVWSVAGRLPTTISGRGILIPPRGVDSIYASGSGLVAEIVVKEGDYVMAGEVVARIEQKELKEKMRGTQRESELKLAGAQQRVKFLEAQVKAKKEALDLGLIAAADYEDSVEALSNARAALAGIQGQSQIEGFQLKDSSEVLATKGGRVVEITVSPQNLVNKGDTIMVLSDETQAILAHAFIPEVGNLADPGMKAEVSPAIYKKQEFGFIRGKVTQASDYPVRQRTLEDMLHNEALVQELTRGGAPYHIIVELERDRGTRSGFKWSSSKGPNGKVLAGMLADVRVVVREQRPIELVIPAVRSWLGI